MTKLLFILKKREDYSPELHYSKEFKTGLYNSALFMNNMINDLGIESKMVTVNDNNDIDREVNNYKPTHCIIEAVWVVPDKFYTLKQLHPNVKWIIRIHSEMPFMANEGISMGWFGDYVKYDNVYLAPNSPRMYSEVSNFVGIANDWDEGTVKDKVVYLPNYYPETYKNFKKIDDKKDTLNIGCFGAIRPLKNHLMQAHAAIYFCNSIGKKLNFHINCGRLEMKGEPVLHNLKGLFEHMNKRGHNLILHDWKERVDFLELCGSMDIGMQVSFSETFNIVAADFISEGVPIVGSSEIPWLYGGAACDPVDLNSIVVGLSKTYNMQRLNVYLNKWYLRKYCLTSKSIWANYFMD